MTENKSKSWTDIYMLAFTNLVVLHSENVGAILQKKYQILHNVTLRGATTNQELLLQQQGQEPSRTCPVDLCLCRHSVAMHKIVCPLCVSSDSDNCD